jgi:hypothetical protein
LIAPALPLLVAAPAHAATNICVHSPPGCPAGSTTYLTIPDAISHAAAGDKIHVGPGTYSDGPYVLPAGVSIQGSGAGTGASATVLTLGAGAQTYLTADGGNVSDLRVSMSSGNGATGIVAGNGTVVDNVVVFGPGSTGSTGLRAQAATFQDATVNVTGGSGNTAVSVAGGTNTFTDSTWNGGAVGLRLVTGSDTVSRVTVNRADTAVRVEAGSLAIDDTVLELGAGGTGLLAETTGAAAADVTAGFLTVVGGAAGSRGVVASTAGTGTATVTLTSSIVRGPTTSLERAGGTASLTVTRSDYQTTQGGVTDGGNNLVGVDPAFVDAASGNYDLRAGSPMIDEAVASAASRDRAGRARSFDGDRDGIAIPDIGAYELHDVTPPSSVITGGPSGPTNDNTPVFTFRSGPDVTFECVLDGTVFQHCTSPVTTTPLSDGTHTFMVRATDEVFNVETNPPRRAFTVDTKAPDTSFTKKPHKRFHKPRVKFKFASNEAGTRYRCKPDNLPWRSCHSPYRWSVKLGRHRLLVRAVDAAGNQDRSPARYVFKRLKHRR